MCFSIVFGKQFLAMGNKARGLSRFNSLLDLFSLTDKLILSPNNYNSCYSKPVNYDDIYEKLNIERRCSIGFIKKLLNKT